MKKLLLTSALIMCGASLSFSQTIPDGGFENWGAVVYENPDMYVGSETDGIYRTGIANCTKTTDKNGGSFALRLETVNLGTDTNFAYILNGDPDGSSGGAPFTQMPTSINGYYKYNEMTGDSAILVVIFRKSGNPISLNYIKIGGSKSTYTAFSFPLATIPMTPDSVIFGAISSNPFGGTKGKVGSYIQLDDISFGGTGITENIPNPGFENWSTKSIDNPSGWANANMGTIGNNSPLQVTKATPAYSGSLALQMKTTPSICGSGCYAAVITTGKLNQTNLNGNSHGRPYTQVSDTLIGFYKYMGMGSDSGSISISCFKNGTPVSTGVTGKTFKTATNYTQFKIPVTCTMAPDSMRIDISSSSFPLNNGKVGSTLTIDNLYLKSQTLAVKSFDFNKAVIVYPNPAQDNVSVSFESENSGNVTLNIYNVVGSKIQSTVNSITVGKNTLNVNTGDISNGVYYVEVINKDKKTTTKFTVAR